MLYILFKLNKDRYAFEATKVVELLPLLKIKEIPKAPLGVAGLINYRSSIIPILDLCEITLGRKSEKKLSTRILIVNYKSEFGHQHLIGLIAENATETVRIEPNQFSYSGVTIEGAPYLGAIAQDENGLTQRLEIDKLLSKQIYSILFPASIEEIQV